MAELKFNCPHCQQPLEATDELFGQVVDCPGCGRELRVPSLQTEPPRARVSLSGPAPAPPPLPPGSPPPMGAANRMAAAPQQQPAPALVLDFENDLRPILERFRGREDFHIAPDIPEAKLENALDSAKVPDYERVAALVDCTVMGSAKNCLLIGVYGIHWHNDWSGETPGPGHIPYAEFYRCTPKKRGLFEVWVDENRSLEVSGCSFGRKQMVQMLEAIRNCCLHKR